MLPVATSYEELIRRFRWTVPDRFNIATAVCGRHARVTPDAPALIEDRGGDIKVWRFAELERNADRLANALAAHGLGRGERIAVLLDQRVETLLAHLAAYKLGAIALPLFRLFGPDAIAYRLQDSGAAAIVTDEVGLAKLAAIEGELPELRVKIAVDGPADGALAFWSLVEAASTTPVATDTAADDPALIIYTSGTTGQPKGALHAHRVLLGHLPGVQLPQQLFPQPGDRFWTPADWAWIGGLLDVLLPSLHFGVPVVAGPGGRFDPEAAVAFMARHGVRNAFLPPTALRMLERAGVQPRAAGARLRSIGSGGERLDDATVAWVDAAFGCPVNEFYGQTEANLLVSGCAALFPRRAGTMGRPVPGHEVAVIDAAGQPLPSGAAGVIAVRRPDPVMFLGYWNRPDATAAKFRGDWLVTGDIGRQEAEGEITFLGREDDLISSAGYRIGPAEIEACLLGHPAVAACAVVGVPDELRGERVKAFIVPAADATPGEALARAIQEFVKTRLAAHEYPREIAFLAELPVTATGKIRRAELRAGTGAVSGRPESP
jgi:acetyl-CoA synthetase